MNQGNVSLYADIETGPQALRRGSISQQIRESLRRRIVSLELVPGAPLSRAEIAAHYGVSQTPVRDAMMKLEEEGLLVVFPQSRTEVSKIDVDAARETQFLRLSIELEVTRRLAEGPNDTLVATATNILAHQRTAQALNDLGRFYQLDRDFHRALYVAAKVGNLWELVAERSGHIDRLRTLNLPDPGKAAQVLQDHENILQAIAAGDTTATDRAVRAHLSGTLATVDHLIHDHPEFF